MSYPISKNQIKYVDSLLAESIGPEKVKLYLKHFYKIEYTRKLTREQAGEIITKFNAQNIERDENIREVDKALKKQWRRNSALVNL